MKVKKIIKSSRKINIVNLFFKTSVQNQVDEVIDVMQENITKVIERGERLDELQDKSGTVFYIFLDIINLCFNSVLLIFLAGV